MEPLLYRLSPCGVGTEGIEAYSSYFSRLAKLHGITSYQLTVLIQSWVQASPQSTQASMPLGGPGIRDNGYGPNIGLRIRALELATGVKGLSATTLSALIEVAGSPSCFSLSTTSRFCPACVLDWIGRGRPLHYRLLWCLLGIERCHEHEVRLMHSCSWCGSRVILDVALGDDAIVCKACEKNAATNFKGWMRAPRPTVEEVHLIGVITHSARNPEHVYTKTAPHTFLERRNEYERVPNLQTRLGDYFHSRQGLNTQPRLGTLVRLAAFYDTPLIDILVCPEQAAKAVAFAFDRVLPTKYARSSIDPKVRDKLIRRLCVRLRRRQMKPSVAEICNDLNVSLGFASYWCKDLTRANSQMNYQLTRARLRGMNIKAAKLITRELVNETIDLVGTQRLAIKALACSTSVPENIVRKRVASLVRKR